MMDRREEFFDRFRSPAEFAAWCNRAPPGTQVSASEVAKILNDCSQETQPEKDNTGHLVRAHLESRTWRERLWTVPAETRLGVVEVSEALGRPKSYVYARTGALAKEPLPHRKMDGVLVFTAGELRTWIRTHEEEIVGLPMESTLEERRMRLEGAA